MLENFIETDCGIAEDYYTQERLFSDLKQRAFSSSLGVGKKRVSKCVFKSHNKSNEIGKDRE